MEEEGGVGVAVAEGAHPVRAEGDPDREGVGVAGAGGEDGGEETGVAAGLHREDQVRVAGVGAAGAAGGGVHGVEGVACLAGQYLARRGQGDGAAGAVEQGDAEAAFEALDRLGQGRLGDAEAGGGAAEVQFLGHRQELRQLPGLQRRIHASRLSVRARPVLDVAEAVVVS